MPSGKVMETFKSIPLPLVTTYRHSQSNSIDLIRHGKHAQQPHRDQQPDQHVQRHTRDRGIDQQKARHQQDFHKHQQQRGAHAASAPTTKAKTSQYTREAEMIVQEEISEQGKMPIFKGLENYKLLEKMGESANFFSSNFFFCF
jgi:serine/threonine-protein kinase RCK2